MVLFTNVDRQVESRLIAYLQNKDTSSLKESLKKVSGLRKKIRITYLTFLAAEFGFIDGLMVLAKRFHRFCVDEMFPDDQICEGELFENGSLDYIILSDTWKGIWAGTIDRLKSAIDKEVWKCKEAVTILEEYRHFYLNLANKFRNRIEQKSPNMKFEEIIECARVNDILGCCRRLANLVHFGQLEIHLQRITTGAGLTFLLLAIPELQESLLSVYQMYEPLDVHDYKTSSLKMNLLLNIRNDREKDVLCGLKEQRYHRKFECIGHFALCMSLFLQRLKIFKTILKKWPFFVRIGGFLPWAVKSGSVRILEAVLEIEHSATFSVNVHDTHGLSLLSFVVFAQRTEMITFLITKLHADPNIRDKFGASPVEYSKAMCNEKIYKLLL